MSIEPYCWRAVGGSIWDHKTCESDTPLYDQAAIDSAVAGERQRWREIVEQLIACHDEPTCPAVAVAKDMLSGL